MEEGEMSDRAGSVSILVKELENVLFTDIISNLWFRLTGLAPGILLLIRHEYEFHKFQTKRFHFPTAVKQNIGIYLVICSIHF